MATRQNKRRSRAMQAIFPLVAFGPIHQAHSEQLWSDNSLALSRGHNYKIGDESRTVLTYEHVSGHTWGDIFLFSDRVEFDDGFNETYWELSPRLSMGKVCKVDTSVGLVSDVLITTTTEIATNVTNYLYGTAIDLNLPGFSVFQLNFYRRNNEDQKDNWQLTPVWAVPFSISDIKFVFEGFADWSSGTEDHHTELNVTSELKLDIGAFFGSEKTLYAGLKYIHIENKFGIKDGSTSDTNERNLNAAIQFHF